MPRFDLRQALLRRLQGHPPANPGDLRRLYTHHRAFVGRRSLSRVTENLKGISLATQLAEEIRARIRAEIDLTASAGVSYNKFLAKLASDHRKRTGCS